MTTVELDSADAVDGRHIRAVTFQSVRLEYLDRVLWELSLRPRGLRALVVGSGRGLLARELARRGFRVTAVDPAAAATELAREADGGTGVEYLTAPPQDLGVPAQSFDLAYCGDTFEITDRLDAVTAEISRALKPDGVLVHDTVNRTPLARLIYLGAFQAVPFTRIMPRGRYAAGRLRPPEELAASLDRAGLSAREVCPFKPKDVRSLVTATRARRRGELTDDDLPGAVEMVLEPDGRPLVTYLGYALRTR